MKKKNIEWEKELTFACFVVPAILLYIMYYIVPMASGVYYSLTDWTGLSPNANFIGLANYVTLLSDAAFRQSLYFNIWYAVLLVVIVICIGTVLALCLNTKIKAMTFFRGTLFFPAVLSMLTIGMIFGEIYTRAIPDLAKSLDI